MIAMAKENQCKFHDGKESDVLHLFIAGDVTPKMAASATAPRQRS